MEANAKGNKANPFDRCPVYQTEHFICKLISEEDAQDLSVCYSDPVTLSHMNNDNCSGEFKDVTAEVMKAAIRSWLEAYEARTFVRLSIIEKASGKAVGTIEIAPLPWGQWFFGAEPPIGILRVDLLPRFERQDLLSEIIHLMASELAEDFEARKVILKAPPDQPEKVNALAENHFTPYTIANSPYGDYYAKDIRTIRVVPYDPDWKEAFEGIKRGLDAALRDSVIAIEHVGSTAVPGLYAKPIIDIDIVIDDEMFDEVENRLKTIGYVHVGDLGIAGREAFKYQGKPHLMNHHLYVCHKAADELRRHLALRDFLRGDEEYQEKFSQIKIEMANRYPRDIDRYIEGKQPVIMEIYAKCGLDVTRKL